MSETIRKPDDLSTWWGPLRQAYEAMGRSGWPMQGAEPETVENFQAWLDALGIDHFRAQKKNGDVGELCRPYNPVAAQKAGYSVLVPPAHLWPWAGLVLLVADSIRKSLGRSVTCRNLWRPASYNDLVATSKKSDHLDACAVDLDFTTEDERILAEGVARGIDRAVPELEMSLGVGKKTLHVGVLSMKGRRMWTYGEPWMGKKPWPKYPNAKPLA